MQAADLETLKKQFTPKEAGQVDADRQVHSARFSPCGGFLFAGGYDGQIRRWQIGEAADAAPQLLPPLAGHRGWVQPVAFHAEAKLLFSADSWGELRAWSYAAEPPQEKWSVADAHAGWIRDLDVSPDGRTLASCGSDRKARLWTAADGSEPCVLADYGEDIYCVRFHSDGQSLLTGDAKGIVKQWRLADGQATREFNAGKLFLYHRLQDVGGVRCLAFDREGQRLAVGGTKPNGGGSVTGIPLVMIFDTSSGEVLHEMELGSTQDVYVCDLAWHEAGFLIVATSGQPGNGKFLLQRPEDKEPLFSTTKLSNCHSISRHPAGRRIAVVTTNRNSNGNGRPLDKDGRYPGNHSPICFFEFPAAEAPVATG